MKKTIPYFLLVILVSSCSMFRNGGKKLSDSERLKIQTVYIEAIREKNLGNLDQATTLLKAILDLDKKHDPSYYLLASISANKNNFSEALMYSEKALAIDPGNKYYQMQEAGLLEQNARYVEAAAIYKMMREGDPNNFMLYYQESECYLKVGKYTEAVSVYNDLESKMGISEEISLQKYRLYSYQKQNKSAINELVKLSSSDPTNYDYLTYVVEAAFEQSQMNLAYDYIGKLIQQDSSDGMNYLYLSHYYKTVGKTDDANKALQKGFNDARVDIDRKISILMEFYLKNNEKDKALSHQLLMSLTQNHPEEAKAWAMFGDFLNRDGDYLQANEKFKTSIFWDNTQFSVWQQMMINFDILKQYDSLLLYSEKAVELFPEQGLAAYYAGYSCYMLKKYEKSIEYLESALSLSSKMKELKIQTLVFLGEAYQKTGQFELSYQNFEKALHADSKNPLVLNNYAYYLSLRKDSLDKALSMIDLALKMEPKNPGYHDTKAWIYFQKQQYKDALIWIEKAMQLGGNEDAAILEHYGDILFKLNKTEEAIIQWEKASKIPGGSETLLQKIKNKALYE